MSLVVYLSCNEVPEGIAGRRVGLFEQAADTLPKKFDPSRFYLLFDKDMPDTLFFHIYDENDKALASIKLNVTHKGLRGNTFLSGVITCDTVFIHDPQAVPSLMGEDFAQRFPGADVRLRFNIYSKDTFIDVGSTTKAKNNCLIDFFIMHNIFRQSDFDFLVDDPAPGLLAKPS